MSVLTGKVLVIVRCYYLSPYLINSLLSQWPIDWHYCINPVSEADELAFDKFSTYPFARNVYIKKTHDIKSLVFDDGPDYDICLLFSDDSVIALPKISDLVSFLEIDDTVGTFHLGDIYCGHKELYGPTEYFTPDNYLAGAILKKESIAIFFDSIIDLNNRWLGHAIALSALEKNINVQVFRNTELAFPCVNQISGLHVKKSRDTVIPLLAQHASTIYSMGLINVHDINERLALNYAEIASAEDKKSIDDFLSDLTLNILSLSSFFQLIEDNTSLTLKGKRVVIFKVECIGDVVTTTPFYEAILNSDAAEVVLVTTEAMRSIFEHDDRYDQIIYFPMDRKKARFNKNHINALELDLKLLATKIADFDVALFPRFCIDTNLYRFISVLLGFKERVGLQVDPVARDLNILYDRMLTSVFIPPYEVHETERMIWFANQLGLKDKNNQKLNIGIRPTRNGAIRPYIVIGLGAASPDRRWPRDFFVELILLLSNKYLDLDFYLLGGDDVLDDAVYISDLTNAINRVGALSLYDSAIAISQATLYVGHDSGLMHISAAIGIPVVEISKHPMSGYLWHANSPKRFGPWGVPYISIQPAKGLPGCLDGCVSAVPHCIEMISPKMVFDKMIKFHDLLKNKE